ncbi:hypothetical protein MSTE_04967 [Mycobacteroides stephanolepidis]|uniref:Uncharacterized protein n=1 Tax=[Mycobacterium] stephanolepidis TaxID=1520670 RepID=A0A1Z4F4Y6_9MYCO|nr:hypothetical protein [[Mycobacterium] stephanolepidis]BAY00259.1 hypothetical protein MSTE_04967 [[Mycobacterium] stephanolepidis]
MLKPAAVRVFGGSELLLQGHNLGVKLDQFGDILGGLPMGLFVDRALVVLVNELFGIVFDHGR